jgi:hypothetical protein
MNKKIFIRIVCILLAVLMLATVILTALLYT